GAAGAEQIEAPGGNAQCAICLTVVEKGTLYTELACRHGFHPACISRWLMQNESCPTCEKAIPVSASHAEPAEEAEQDYEAGADGVNRDDSAKQPEQEARRGSYGEDGWREEAPPVRGAADPRMRSEE
ncbi:unnamed protein product, partial [Prorocentrum cordatum]